ncbi:MAG: hypothetical protein AB7H93_12225 [Vicinamibacterales bacterium]
MLVARFVPLAAAAVALWLSVVGLQAQRSDAFQESRHHPALKYGPTAPSDAVARLNARLESGEVTLHYTPGPRGYLPAVLEALGLSPTSQGLVFSATSLQASHITQANPRAIYFGDDVSVAFIRGAPLVEVAAQDPVLGTVFYQLSQTESPAPRFNRSETCLSCHLSWDTRAVPGPFVLTTFPRRSDRDYANGGIVDHREALDRRWGGWYVTGAQVPRRHMGNVALVGPHAAPPESTPPPPALKTLAGAGLVRDEGDYLAPYSDVVALLVLEHQLHAMNLMTRAAWEYRLIAWTLARGADTDAAHVLSPREADAVDELADYLLFVDEVPLGVVQGTSGFAEAFAARGPADAAGRSLRQLKLDGRLMRYPLSYTVYSTAFDALPGPMKDAVYQRLWAVLSGRDARPKYAHLSKADRQAIIEILRATKPGLPDTFAATAPAR